ncbi:MAG: YHYH protein [Campylobacteraceae bacterium]|nr:YHYH protein [Campylobacteraceae bacterium]
MRINKILMSTLFLYLIVSSALANRMPPREAILACEGKSMQETCQFQDRKGILTGVCNDKPGIMACAPNRGKQTFQEKIRPPKQNSYTNSNIAPKQTKYSNNTSGQNTFKLEAWADNWFAAYDEDTLLIEDSVSITSERSFNAESVVFQANYPLHLNFILKDFKQNDTGLEYIGRHNQQIGDGGFIMQITDTNSGDIIAVSNKNMKCMVIHKAPLNKSCKNSSSPQAGIAPCEYKISNAPLGWKNSSFDDSSWNNASEHSLRSVRPKGGYNNITWSSKAKLIWSEELELDNTVLCRISINNPNEKSSSSTSSTNLTSGVTDVFKYFHSNNVHLSESDSYIHISSDGIPAGELMVGIQSWQQQVPLPQNYRGDNAWLLTKNPQASLDNPSLLDNFYMGAVGLAVDGTPIFNPLNNRGDDAYLVGELDHLGGHSGRADDYHYHTAPTHLNSIVGNDKPIAFILDGYALYGFYESDGTKVDYSSLDKNKGHSHDKLGYHYHASKEYPYINQSMYGKVKISLDSRGNTNFISPQPKTKPLRKSLEPLRGAEITGFTVNQDKTFFSLSYNLRGKVYTLFYELVNDTWKFTIPNHDGTNRVETYKAVKNNKFVHSHSH